jgi:hypothetical protein
MTTHRVRASAEKPVEVKATAAETTRMPAGAARLSTYPMTGEKYIASIRDGRESA